MKGKLIVIDGTDGSGKATQTARLKERLIAEGHQVESMDFPQYYNNFFGKLIGDGLAGKLGDWVHLNPKIASVMYAADRFESSTAIQQWLDDGAVVILDRYVSSNQIHHGGKIDNDEERREFLSWLDTMEHEIFKSPRPDIILYLDLPIAVSQQLVLKKSNQDSKKYLDGNLDQHENDPEHLENAKQAGLKMTAETNNWVQIQCAPDGENILPIDEIHEALYGYVADVINE